MKTIRYHIAAGGMLAALACVMLAGSASADDVGRVRLTDSPTQEIAPAAEGDLVVRGSSNLRHRNARTTGALQRLFSGSDAGVQSAAPVRQVGHHQVISAGACCPADDCCAPTCAAPDECCAPSSCAPECCAPDCGAPNDCCAPDCCAPNDCCAPAGCCPPVDCGCPVGQCDCAPDCECPADSCCCPSGCDCAPGSCACPAGDCCCPEACDGCDGCTTSGRTRISDLFGGNSDARGTGYDNGNGRRAGLKDRRHARTCRHGYSKGHCPFCRSGSLANRHCVSNFMCRQAAAHRARNRLASNNVNEYLHCKFGYFIHDGHGGVGSPMFGHYSVVYPVDPGYFDGRDGGVYAAQGYGGAVSVPLAPTVRHAWNYGWGIPSSRLTPVSNTPAP